MVKEATELLNFPTELYVGTENLRAFDAVDPPLAFATPNGKDKAFEKRKENVDKWCGDGIVSVRAIDPATGEFKSDGRGRWEFETTVVGTTKPFVIPNTFLEGYRFDEAIERYVTNNKVFRITDPRGFQLEISADNLADIILNCDITHGRLVGEFIWARQRGTNFLCRKDHPSYIQSVSPAISRELQVGDHVYLSNKRVELVYCGDFFVYTANDEIITSQYSGHGQGWGGKYHYTVRVDQKWDDRPMRVFKQVDDEANTYDGPYYHLRKPGKIEILSEGNPLPSDFFVGGQFVRPKEYSALVNSFFTTKAELLAFKPSLADIKRALVSSSKDCEITYVD